MRNTGQIVKTKKGNRGRTYSNQELINGKMAVYLELEGEPYKYESRAILCDPNTLKFIGYID